MMRATGTLFMSKAQPLPTTAADGMFSLSLLAYDRLGVHQVEPWRVIYSGPHAFDFWQTAKHALKPGAPIVVEAERLRCAAQPMPRVTEFQVHATRITLAPAYAGTASNTDR